MKFIKENSYDIVRFFIYQLGIAVFSLTLAIPLETAVEDEQMGAIVQFCVSLLAVAFYSVLVYTVSWDHGATDRIRIDAGKTSYDPYKGAKIAMLACVPNLLVSAVAIISALLHSDGNAWTAVLGVTLMVLGLMESMYLGTVELISSLAVTGTQSFFIIKSICFFVLPFVVVLSAHFGYAMGDKNKKIFGFLSNKKKKK